MEWAWDGIEMVVIGKWECKWSAVIWEWDVMGMGGIGNSKSHSRTPLLCTDNWLEKRISVRRLVKDSEIGRPFQRGTEGSRAAGETPTDAEWYCGRHTIANLSWTISLISMSELERCNIHSFVRSFSSRLGVHAKYKTIKQYKQVKKKRTGYKGLIQCTPPPGGGRKYISLFIVAWTKELLHLYSELKNEYISLRTKAANDETLLSAKSLDALHHRGSRNNCLKASL